MDIERLLKEAGALDRALEEATEHSERNERLRQGSCRTAWQILVQKSLDEGDSEEWWQRHGSSCPTCIHARSIAERSLSRRSGPGAHEELMVLEASMDMTWPVELPFAAADESGLFSQYEELPWVQYHMIARGTDQGLATFWLVTWDNMLFAVLCGPRQKLDEWRGGAVVRDSMGNEIGGLCPSTGRIAEILAPEGALQGMPAACFSCDLSVSRLKGMVFIVSELAGRGIQIVPRPDGGRSSYELVQDLVMSNFPSAFLDRLPECLDSEPDALTLNAYIRLLLHRACVSRDSCQNILSLEWVADDIRAVVQRLVE